MASDGADSENEAVPPPIPLTVEGIYDAHFDFVWRGLRRMGVAPERLDDAAQDVFLVVHRRLCDFAQRSTIKTWLFGIVTHVARDHCRSQRRKARVIREDLPEYPEAVADAKAQGPLQHAEHAEAIRLLEGLLARVSPEKREVFLLSELEQMTAPEISDALSLPLTTVYSRLRAARSEFEQALVQRRTRDSGGLNDTQQ